MSRRGARTVTIGMGVGGSVHLTYETEVGKHVGGSAPNFGKNQVT